MNSPRTEPPQLPLEAERWFAEHPDASLNDWIEHKELRDEDKCEEDE